MAAEERRSDMEDFRFNLTRESCARITLAGKYLLKNNQKWTSLSPATAAAAASRQTPLPVWLLGLIGARLWVWPQTGLESARAPRKMGAIDRWMGFRWKRRVNEDSIGVRMPSKFDDDRLRLAGGSRDCVRKKATLSDSGFSSLLANKCRAA